ncbi:hypothetical protein Tco_0307652 [Tanacetum coccineum]
MAPPLLILAKRCQEGEVLSKFPRFLDALVMKLATCSVVNFTLKRVRDIIIENLDLESKIYAMMRDFLNLVVLLDGKIEKGNE